MRSFFQSTAKAVYPVWKDSVAGDVTFAPISKRQAAKLFHDARRFEGKTRKPGKQDGAIGRNGILILQALLFDFIDYVSGRLEPSYETIARHANISVRSVANGLAKLRDAGVLTWQRRCAWNDKNGQLEQLTNAYGLAQVSNWKGYRPPERPPAPQAGTWGDHPPTASPLSLAVDAIANGTRSMVQAALDLDPGDTLATVLGRLNRTRGLT